MIRPSEPAKSLDRHFSGNAFWPLTSLRWLPSSCQRPPGKRLEVARECRRKRDCACRYNSDMFRFIPAAVTALAMTVSGVAQDSQATFQGIYAVLATA